jgi:putative transport protein
MDWLVDLFFKESVAQTILIYCFVIALGVALGKIKIFKISLGITFVLFAGIAIGHYGFKVNKDVLEFVRNFGLILFVFSIGLQVGPGFFASFKKGGITLNLLAVFVVVLGVAAVIILHFVSGISMPMMVGIMSGGVTNTPGLGAAQQALSQAGESMGMKDIPNIGLGYAVAYPFGVLGVILSMLLIRRITRADMKKESEQYGTMVQPHGSLPVRVSVMVSNPAVFGTKLSELSRYFRNESVISRILHKGEVFAVNSDTVLEEGDVVLVVAQKDDMDVLVKMIGKPCDFDLAEHPGKLVSRQVLVTNSKVAGKPLSALKLRSRFAINITRVARSGLELVAYPTLLLQMGDRLTIVGDETSIEKAAEVLGNSLKRLDQPNIVPIFTGILLGVLLGSIPFAVPGIPTPIKLGLAGGPLIIAILLSKFGHKFSIVPYVTASANLLLREIGMVLFLASVGIQAGEKFIPTLMSGDGFVWMGYGAIITSVPVIVVALISRLVYKRSYFETCGLLAGSMTDPPALAFANSMTQSEAPAVAYATVYPLVMFLRIVAAQLLIMLFL